jgi:hypothetical protein
MCRALMLQQAVYMTTIQHLMQRWGKCVDDEGNMVEN